MHRVVSLALGLLPFAAATLPACDLPGCIPASTDPPGDLPPAQVPQMVLLTCDDSLSQERYDLFQSVVTNFFNPDGRPVRATFFITCDRSDYVLVNRLYAAGHEIAVHALNYIETNTREAWRRDIAGARHALANHAKIPFDDIRGFRTPNLACNSNTFAVLHEHGFLYDASALELLGSLSPGLDRFVWPYTLDHGLIQREHTGTGPEPPYPAGLLEIPLWGHHDTNNVPTAAMDPWPDKTDEPLALLQHNFTQRYTGNRAPYGLFLHLQRLSGEPGRVAVLRTFLDWVQTHEDVWFVTMQELSAYLRDPVDTAGAFAFPPFQPPLRSAWTGDVQVCSFPGHTTFSVCGISPPVFPEADTVFLGIVEEHAGTAIPVLVTNKLNSYYADLVVSNETAQTALAWRVAFRVDGGDVTSLWDADWRSGEDGREEARSATGDPPLPPGGTTQFGFRVGKWIEGGTVTVQVLDQRLGRLGTVPTGIEHVARHPDGLLDLSWSETGLGYHVETAPRPGGPWIPWSTSMVYQAAWTGLPPDGAMAIRVRVEP